MQAGNANLHAELSALIEDENHKEEECRQYLSHVRYLLVDVTSAEYVDEAEEYRGHSGDSDYLIVCSAIEGSGIKANIAYLWEAKAPQVYIFEHDTKNRVRPTKDFISAENQLLHYYEDCKGSDSFKEEFNITHRDNVRLGGIIIGSEKTWVKSKKYDDRQKEALYTRAINLRRRVLYGSSGIKVMTWDHILRFLAPREPLDRSPQAELPEPISIDRPNYTIVEGSGN